MIAGGVPPTHHNHDNIIVICACRHLAGACWSLRSAWSRPSALQWYGPLHNRRACGCGCDKEADNALRAQVANLGCDFDFAGMLGERIARSVRDACPLSCKAQTTAAQRRSLTDTAGSYNKALTPSRLKVGQRPSPPYSIAPHYGQNDNDIVTSAVRCGRPGAAR